MQSSAFDGSCGMVDARKHENHLVAESSASSRGESGSGDAPADGCVAARRWHGEHGKCKWPRDAQKTNDLRDSRVEGLSLSTAACCQFEIALFVDCWLLELRKRLISSALVLCARV